MKLVAICLVAVVLSDVVLLFAVQGAESNGSNLSSLQVDFGDSPTAVIPLDKGIKHRFTVRNIGDSELIIELKTHKVETGEVIHLVFPQPQRFYLSPGEEHIVTANLEMGPEYGVGVHSYLVNYTFQNVFDTRDSISFIRNYTFTVLDRANITGDFMVRGKVVDEYGQAIQGALVELRAADYDTRVNSGPNGTFSFSVPPNPNWWLRVSKNGYKALCIFDLKDTSYILTLAKFSEDIPKYELVKQVTTDIGFWKAIVSADEKYILLVQAMENWVDLTLRNQSRIMLYTLDGEKVWEYLMGWPSWGADLSRDGKYAVYVTEQPPGRPDELVLLDALTGTLIWKKELTAENFPPNRLGVLISKEVQFSHNGEYIGIGTGAGDFYLLNRETGNILWDSFTEGQIRKITFANDDAYVYVGSGDGNLYKFVTNNGTLLWKAWILSWPYTYGLALSPDESMIAAGVKSGEVTVIRTDDGAILWSRDLGQLTVGWVQFSPDGRLLVAGSAVTGTNVLNASDGTLLWRIIRSGGAGMWTHDGRYLLAEGGGKGLILTLDGTLVTELDPGFNTQYWKVAYITRDKSKIIFAARDMKAGNVGIAFFAKANLPPIANFTFDPSAPQRYQDVQFTDTSYNPEGGPITYLWNFGDGYTSTTKNPSHKYEHSGNYNVTLIVTDNEGETGIKTLIIAIKNLAPTAAFTYSPSNPTENQDVQFTDASTDPEGKLTTWNWDFGDGTTSTTRSPIHKYSNAGTYTVKLTVKDDEGASDVKSIGITVQAVPFWTQTWFYLLIFSVIIAAMVVFVVLKRRTAFK